MKKKDFSRPRVPPQQKIVLVFLGLFLSLVLLEAGLRFGGFIFSSTREYGHLRSLMRKGDYRILCLGESTTQGGYPSRLEQVLNQRHIGVRFSVSKKAKGGCSTFYLLDRIESDLAEYHPDMVVAMMGINDPGEHIPLEAATASKGTLFIRSSRVYKLMRLLWLHLLTQVKEAEFCKTAEAGQSPEEIRTLLPGAGSKGTSVEAIPGEGPFKKAIELDPKNDEAYFELGRLYRDQEKISQAADCFKKAIELNPKNDRAHAGLGELYFHLGRFEFSEAENSLKRAVEVNPKNDPAFLQLGELYRVQGKFPQAAYAYRKAIELNPKNNKYAYVELGWIYRAQGELPRAEDLFEKAIEMNPDDDTYLGAMASLYEETGKPELERAYAEKANRLRAEYYNPQTVSNYRKLKQILDRKRIQLVCVQYPMRNVAPLKKIFKKDKGILFVDNESLFKQAVKKEGYKEYFTDMFAGDFGHFTQKSNELLAQNIADVILREIFNK